MQADAGAGGRRLDDALLIVDRSGTKVRGSAGRPHDQRESGPAAHGRRRFVEALAARGVRVDHAGHWSGADQPVVVLGTTDDRRVQRLLGGDRPSEPESLVYRWCPTEAGEALVVAGSDDRGLMYALLELAERVEADGVAAIGAVADTVERPRNRVRGMNRFLAGAIEDTWLYDEDFWHAQLAMLAACRFNRFVLVTGYDTAYMSPPYPYFVTAPDYPQVRTVDPHDRGQEANLAQLRRIGQLCHDYGLDFFFATWQQIPWTAEQQRLIEGLPEDEEQLAGYCAAGLRELLVACPEIDGVQLRVNHESGVGDQSTAGGFWAQLIHAVADAAAQSERNIVLDPRAKGLTDELIAVSLDTGLDVEVHTKYWCEATGLPHHNVRMRTQELLRLDNYNHSRRYSHADLLRKPHWYDMVYGLWVFGTNRVFVWGDPDYTRRFSHSCGISGGAGWEITAPLTLKGGHALLQSERWPLHADPELRHYRWEDERYWLWYRLFGRAGYSPDAQPEAWRRELRRRFGPASAGHVEDAYRAASKVLPLITAFHMPQHPALVYWVEMDTGGALFAAHNYNRRFAEVSYGTTEPSDPGIFYRIDEYVEDEAKDAVAAKYTPLQVRRWLGRFASDTRAALAAAEAAGVDTADAEYRATRVDLLMLADLAECHTRRIAAAVALHRHEATPSPAHLRQALAAARAARESWAALSERGAAAYHHDLVFGNGPNAGHRAGTWGDRLEEFDADIAELERLLGDAPADGDRPSAGVEPAAGLLALPSLVAAVPERHPAGQDLVVDVVVGELGGVERMDLHYRHVNQIIPWRVAAMERTDRGFRGRVPAAYLDGRWDLQLYLTTLDAVGEPVLYPGLYHAEHPQPYLVVEVVPGG